MTLLPFYAAYALVALALTVWLARTLFDNGAVFLDDTFGDRPDLAAAVNRLLVTGFFMLNLGYAMFLLRSDRPADATAAVENLAYKLGVLLVSLAFIHFANLIVFNRVRAAGRPRRRINAATATAFPLPAPVPPPPGPNPNPAMAAAAPAPPAGPGATGSPFPPAR